MNLKFSVPVCPTGQHGPIGCPETSVRNYHYWLRNSQEERSSQRTGFSGKSQIIYAIVYLRDCFVRRWVSSSWSVRTPRDGISVSHRYFARLLKKNSKSDWRKRPCDFHRIRSASKGVRLKWLTGFIIAAPAKIHVSPHLYYLLICYSVSVLTCHCACMLAFRVPLTY
jgi:hypothetical protein